ncbi:hypothetical protein HBB06_16385 [Streptomyces sp. SNU607]|uniref:hypothetical protein n=1 Tax=Streptomyces sp. SNU607 TaxID=2718875 RepID=UPI0026E02A36|nr:hypothetical protein [Streptomyces sp. SNU607]WKV79602.1 hypothetical protein HBB06_16385 [Streptomyces sp. SNU607]
MPATLVAPRLTPPTSAPAPLVSVEELSHGERKVALYASDMPNRYRYRKGDDAQIVAWIRQGVARLGLEELYLSAAYASGYRLLEMSHAETAEQTQAHLTRFPNSRRLDRAGSLAALTITGSGRIPCSAAAIARNHHALVEGACDCGGTGWMPLQVFDGEALSLNCPAHNPTGDRPNTRAAVSA